MKSFERPTDRFLTRFIGEKNPLIYKLCTIIVQLMMLNCQDVLTVHLQYLLLLS